MIKSLQESVDSILGIRDSIGAAKAEVWLARRVWDGPSAGQGNYQDYFRVMKPTPNIVDYSQDIRIAPGGVMQQGDILLKGVSKFKFPRSEIEGISDDKNVELFFRINKVLYRTISLTEDYVTFNVQIRPVTPRVTNG